MRVSSADGAREECCPRLLCAALVSAPRPLVSDPQPQCSHTSETHHTASSDSSRLLPASAHCTAHRFRFAAAPSLPRRAVSLFVCLRACGMSRLSSLPMQTPPRTAHVGMVPPNNSRAAYAGHASFAAPPAAAAAAAPGGLTAFAVMRGQAQQNQMLPPRTPQANINGAGGYAQYAHSSQHAPSSSVQTPMKQEAHGGGGVPRGYQTPAPISVATTASPLAPRTPATPGVGQMSEAENAKLNAALQQFVLVSLQQKSAAVNAAGGRIVPGSAEVKNYATLLAQLSAEHKDPLALSRWYAALNSSVSSLHATHHAALLDLLYAFDYTRAASVRNVEEFTKLLMAMCVGGNIQALAPALKTLVKSFIATNVPLATISAASVSPALYGRAGDAAALPSMTLGEASASFAPSLSSSAAGSEAPTMDSIHDLVHTALTRLIQLLPSSPTVLFPLLVDLFPHKRLDVTVQLVWVKNLLRVSEYAPSLRDRILTAIIERMIHMDVEIVHEQDEEADEDETEDEQPLFGEDGLPLGEPDLQFSMSGAAPTPVKPAKPLSESRIMANKLDSLMCLMFEYLHLIRQAAAGNSASGGAGGAAASGPPKNLAPPTTPTAASAAAFSNLSLGPPPAASSSSSSSSVAQVELCDEVFSSLLRVFSRSILRTHNSRFLQFLLFYYCDFKHLYAETFLKYLMEKAFDVHTPTVERVGASSYIASFVARAKYLRHASAVVAFEMMLKWSQAYTEYHCQTTQAALAASLANSSYSKAASSINPATLVVPEVGPLEASQHAVFYRIVQSVLYIFCYRQDSFRSMLDAASGHAAPEELLVALQMDRLLASPLNPLRYVSTGVIEEFCRVNEALGGVVDVSKLVARNAALNASSMLGARSAAGPGNSKWKAHHTSNGQSSGGGIGGSSGMDAAAASASASRFDPNDIFFPFDPYLLKHSSNYIDPLFITYGADEEEDDESDGDSDDDLPNASIEEENSSEGESSDSNEEFPHVPSSNGRAAARPIRIRTLADGSSAASGASGARAIKGRKRKMRLASSLQNSFSPGIDGLATSSPELEAGLSSMSASFSEQLSLSLAASPVIHPAGGAAANMSFEIEPGAFMALPPSIVRGHSTGSAIAAAHAASSSSSAAATSAASSSFHAHPAHSSRPSRRDDSKSTTITGAQPARKSRKHTHGHSSDDDEAAPVVLNDKDLSFSDSPPFNPLGAR